MLQFLQAAGSEAGYITYTHGPSQLRLFSLHGRPASGLPRVSFLSLIS